MDEGEFLVMRGEVPPPRTPSVKWRGLPRRNKGLRCPRSARPRAAAQPRPRPSPRRRLCAPGRAALHLPGVKYLGAAARAAVLIAVPKYLLMNKHQPH